MSHIVSIGFCSKDTLLGRIVRYLTNSPINHVFLTFESTEWGGEWVAQADQEGVRLLPIKRALKGAEYVEQYECLMSLSSGMKEMAKYVGCKYDWKGVIWGIFCLAMWKLFMVKFFKRHHSLSRMFCSEFVAEILKQSQVPETERWDTSLISPGDIRAFVLMSKLFRKVV
jgi:hypothetical protein